MLVTAAGPLPGKDFRGALAAMSQALPEILPWPELPAREPGNAGVGRTIGILDQLGFEVRPTGWRLGGGSSIEHRAASSRWRRDLDDAEELLTGFDQVLKVGITGPWTLAATIERPRGGLVLGDRGALREIHQALEEGAAWLRSELGKRVPAARLLLQVNEPLLVAVEQGQLPTASGLRRHPVIPGPELAQSLQRFSQEAVLHSGNSAGWLPVAKQAQFATASISSRLFHTPQDLDQVGEWLADGGRLIAGVVADPATATPGTDELLDTALRLLRPLELEPASLIDRVILGTGDGLENWEQGRVSGLLSNLRRSASLLSECLLEQELG